MEREEAYKGVSFFFILLPLYLYLLIYIRKAALAAIINN